MHEPMNVKNHYRHPDVDKLLVYYQKG